MFLILNLDYDIFSYDDLIFHVIENKKLKDINSIYKLWFIGVKHVLAQLNNFEKERASEIRDKLKFFLLKDFNFNDYK
jgi:hypothetical protein